MVRKKPHSSALLIAQNQHCISVIEGQPQLHKLAYNNIISASAKNNL